ncbi:iron-containing alcohol dehydrogenase [uncultured Cohaesibacter sp.]|uniref:iron-containing alcohol dehydrogenase n=1 Tax=uncultured Cohaesibacter sp. TaxID=1002546 RepID=UPI00292DA5DE|nr:iron-containing alcohol dehydrogenase [uncultured Cohaesibacter sp.]
MAEFVFDTTPSVRCGAGLSAHIGPVIADEYGSSVMVVTDAGLVSVGLVDQAVKSLEKAGVRVVLFDGVVSDPCLDVVNAARLQAVDESVEVIIGLGGGSCMDVAKLVAWLVHNNECLGDVTAIDMTKGGRLPLVLIPTTAGTGAEVMPVAVVAIEGGEKKGLVSRHFLPDLAVLDAKLTLGLPASITAETGMDAIVHAIEAYTSTSLNNNPISKGHAKGALELLGGNILAAVKDGSNLEVRTNMLLGSFRAGQAAANSPLAAVHALCYPICSRFEAQHGLVNAILLPHVMTFNASVCADDYTELAVFLFPDLVSVAKERRPALMITRLADLVSALGLRTQLRQLDIKREELAELALDVMKKTRLLHNNPRPVDEAAALAIYKAAW